MIAFIEGTLVEKTPTRVVLNVGGVGYEALISLGSYDRLPMPGEPCRLLTHEHIREDDHTLYGFVTSRELEMFRRLIAVSGVGPKTALAALSGLTPRDLVAAVKGGDVKRLSSISGIGKKTAERIIVELKDRFTEAEALEAAAAGVPPDPHEAKRRDAVLALVALGYRQADAAAMVEAIPAEKMAHMTVEHVIRNALMGR